MTSRLLVTGAQGLVGSALKEHAPQDTVFVTRSDADLTDFHQTLDLFVRHEPTHVIHLAAVVGGIGGNLMFSGDFFRQNILINTNVLEAARQVGVERLVSFMSTCVFPDAAPYPLTPGSLHEGPPHPSNFGYAYAKRMLEVQSRAYRAQWGADFFVAVPTNVYGPHDNWSLTEGHVVPALIHKALLASQAHEPLIVWGSGRPLREFVFSADIARIALWMVRSYRDVEPLILTSGIETRISDLVSLIVECVDPTLDVVFDSTKPDGQYRKPSDPRILQALLPSFEFTPLELGIRQTVDWFLANYPQVRM